MSVELPWTPVEHYAEADRLLKVVDDGLVSRDKFHLAKAQVHATLAQAGFLEEFLRITTTIKES